MRKVLIVIFMVSMIRHTGAADFSQALQIIQKEGEFIFTDGSSYYQFRADRTFNSGPISMSGRTIQGKWQANGEYQFIVEGKWGWMNGVSAMNDKRKLVINIQPPFSLEQTISKTERTFIPQGKHPIKIYKCYFTIEELSKLQ